ncbi:MAG: hypothetical protein ACYC67_24495 [Prosthecobacter sp.]
MRTKIIRGIAAIIKVLAGVSAVIPFVNPEVLPQKFVVPALVVFALVSASKDGLITVCDILDDGKRNGSFDVSKLPLMALLCCCVGLMSCAGLTAWAASPLGQATIATATALGKQVAKTAETAVLAQIIVKAEAQAAALKAQGENADVPKEILRQSEIAGLAGVVEAAQTKYQMLTGARYVVLGATVAEVGNLQRLAKTSGKQPSTTSVRP